MVEATARFDEPAMTRSGASSGSSDFHCDEWDVLDDGVVPYLTTIRSYTSTAY